MAKLTKKNISNFIRWSSSRYNELTKPQAIDLVVKVITGQYHSDHAEFESGSFCECSNMSSYGVYRVKKYSDGVGVLERGRYDEDNCFQVGDQIIFG